MEMGFHIGVSNGSYWSFDHCLEWARRDQLKDNRIYPRPEDVRGGIDAPVKPGMDGCYPSFFTPGFEIAEAAACRGSRCLRLGGVLRCSL